MASRIVTGRWLIALACLGALYTASFGGLQVHPAFGDGPSVYIVSGLSLAHGMGYRLPNYPGAPPARLYPIGYPLLLSFIFRVVQFGPKSIFLCRLLNVFAALVWAEAARRLLERVVRPFLAAAVALTMAMSPLMVEMTGQIKADIIFGTLLVAAVFVATGSSQSDIARRALRRGVILGVLAASAMLVRTIGFTLVLGLALEMVVNRRRSQLLGFILAAGLVLAPWMLWSSLHHGGTFQSYTSENEITWRTPLSHFWLLTTSTAPTLAFAPFEAPQWHAVASRIHILWLMAVIGFAIVALVIVGWLNLLRMRHPIAYVIAPYMVIVFLWWFEPTRFIIPVLPLLVYCAAVGAKLVRYHFKPAAISIPVAMEVISIFGCLLVDVFRLDRAYRYGDIQGAQAASDWHQIHEGLNWIKENTPGDSVVFSSYPEGVYLFTSRLTLDLNNGAHVGPVYVPIGQMDLEAQFRKGSAFPAAYVFATYRWDYLKQMEWGLGPVDRYIVLHPGQLELKWASSDGHAFIYKLAQQALVAGRYVGAEGGKRRCDIAVTPRANS